MAFVHEHIILPLGDLLRGETVHSQLKNLKEVEKWSDSQLHEFQQIRLQRLLAYAADEVPFYRDWFHDHQLHPQGATLEQMPIVNKAIMRQEGIERFTAVSAPQKDRIISRSSGSTGEPFTYYVSREASSVNTAAKLRTWYQAGYRLGDCYMKIANGERQGKLKKWQDRMNRCIFVPFYSIDEASLSAILDTIEKERPLYIRSYPAPIYLLARYRNSLSDPEPVTPGERTAIDFTLNDIAHIFQKGHRIVVQVQSSWFPIMAMSPQFFQENPYTVRAADYRPCSIKVWSDSRVGIPVVSGL